MHSRWARFAAATGLTVAVAATGMVAGSGTAGASAPIILGSCDTSVQGTPGTALELSPSAVVQPVVNIVHALDPLNLITPTFSSAFTALPPIPLGNLPSGSGTVSGSQIAGAVDAQLNNIPVLGPILTLVTGNVRSTLTQLCSIGVQGINAAVAPVQDGTAAVAKASQQAFGGAPKSGSSPGSGGTPSQSGSTGGTSAAPQGGGSGMPTSNSPVVGGVPLTDSSFYGPTGLLTYGFAESPMARYAGIPFATAGLFSPSPGVRYGGSVPGYAPQYGVLGQGDNPANAVTTAGHAEALGPGSLPGTNVGLPMLLAVLALSMVTAALVRTWVLRRVRSS